MANNNRLELVIEVDVNRGNASIKTMNSTLSSLEQTATRVGRGASSGIDAITVSMAKGAAAGNVFADAIERGLGLAKEWTLGAVQTAAGVDQMRTSLHALAGSHNVSQEQTQRSIKTLKDLGFSTKEALLFTERMIIANIGLEKATRLATLARNAMATKFGTGGSPEEALEKIVMSIESGSSRGLRPYGLWVQFSKAQEIQAKLTGHALSEEEIQAIRLNDVFRAGHKIAGEYASIANGTAEKERLLNEEKMATKISLEEKNKELVGLTVENAKAEADAKAYSLSAVMGSVAKIDPKVLNALASIGMEPSQLIALSFRELAESAAKIGELNISPDLLRELTKKV